MIILFFSYNSNAQSKTGKICFIRSTGYTGSAVNDKVYIDVKLACKLKNKEYSYHVVSVGDHTISAKSTGLSSGKKSNPFKVTVEEDKITYVDLVLSNNLAVDEITKNSADVKMKGLKENTNCDTTE